MSRVCVPIDPVEPRRVIFFLNSPLAVARLTISFMSSSLPKGAAPSIIHLVLDSDGAERPRLRTARREGAGEKASAAWRRSTAAKMTADGTSVSITAVGSKKRWRRASGKREPIWQRRGKGLRLPISRNTPRMGNPERPPRNCTRAMPSVQSRRHYRAATS